MFARGMTRAARITALLTTALQPQLLEVIDDSAKHAGHVGAQPGGETHYRLRIQAATLSGSGKVEQHRRIYALLAPELQNGLHALSIEIIP
jgi:BolA family transcriptional regulator, general stress-responsive regulator